MEEPTPLHTAANPSYADRIAAAIQRHPAGKGQKHLTPALQASGAPKPVKNLKRVK